MRLAGGVAAQSGNAEADEDWLVTMEKKDADLKESKAQTATLTMVQFGFLLELARE